MERLFILTDQFEKQLKAFDNSDDLLQDIEEEINKDLETPFSSRDVIKGTGGFTKIRIPLKIHKIGKSGALRVIYLDSPQFNVVFLMMVYSKSNFSNLSDLGRQTLKEIGQELKEWRPKKRS